MRKFRPKVQLKFACPLLKEGTQILIFAQSSTMETSFSDSILVLPVFIGFSFPSLVVLL